jgi:hypothetical protein
MEIEALSDPKGHFLRPEEAALTLTRPAYNLLIYAEVLEVAAVLDHTDSRIVGGVYPEQQLQHTR